MHQLALAIGLEPTVLAPHCSATGTAEGADPGCLRLRFCPLPVDQMFPFGTDPGFAMRAGQNNRALGPFLVFPPRPSLLGADRAFHVDTLAAAIGFGARFQLCDLVGF